MFGHLFRYALKAQMRTRETMFWTLVFPFALSSFMYLAFSNVYETTEKFHTIPVAVVAEKENPVFDTMLETVCGGGGQPLMKVTRTDGGKAEGLLEKEEVKGIIHVADTVSLEVNENGMEQTILRMFLNQFARYQKAVADVVEEHPERLAKVAERLGGEVDYFVEAEISAGNQDNIVNYFYAIFAMVCLFASFAGFDRISIIQANISALGQRRGVSPTHKLKSMLADFAACELVQYVIVCLLFLYMKFGLGIDFGTKYPAIFLLLFVGTSCGIMFGILIGSLPKPGPGGKISILVSVGMALCTMSDLLVNGVSVMIEHHVPVLNDINPARLITDSFYALNIYDNYRRFGGNLLILCGITGIFAVICYFMVRRNRYASL